jgi:hypothetical protein
MQYDIYIYDIYDIYIYMSLGSKELSTGMASYFVLLVLTHSHTLVTYLCFRHSCSGPQDCH